MQVEKLSNLVDYLTEQSVIKDKQGGFALSFIKFVTIDITFGTRTSQLHDLMFGHLSEMMHTLLFQDDASLSYLVDTEPTLPHSMNMGFTCKARDESFRPIPLGVKEHECFAFTLPLTPRFFKQLRKECSEYELHSFRDSVDVRTVDPRSGFSNNALRLLHLPKMTMFGQHKCGFLADIKEDQEYLNIVFDILPQIKSYKLLERYYRKLVDNLSFACFKFPLVIEL